MKILLLSLFFIQNVYSLAITAKQKTKFQEIEREFDQKAIQLKAEKRARLAKMTNQLISVDKLSDMECITFADAEYGVSRLDAIEACQGEVSMECARFADAEYGVSRMDAIKACRGRINMECVKFADAEYGVSRMQAIKECGGGRVDMECVKYADAQYGVSRVQAIQKCKETYGHGRGKKDC